MALEKSAGAVIFRKERDKIYYLLLHYPRGSRTSKDYWDFPKGHIEKGEKEIETVKREIKEEIGTEEIKIIPGFKEVIKYFYKLKGENIFKIVTFFLAKSLTKKVKISREHIGYKWLPYEETIEQLTFNNSKEILKKANDYLKLKMKNEN